MRDPSTLPAHPEAPLTLGVPGFTFEDLYRAKGLERLSAAFDAQLAQEDASLHASYAAYRHAGGTGLPAPQESELLIRVGEHVSRFVIRLFRIEKETDKLRRHLTGELPLFEFRREFIQRRVFKKGVPNRPALSELPELQQRVMLLLALGFNATFERDDGERALAESILTLLEMERVFNAHPDVKPERAVQVRGRWASLRASLLATPEGKDAFGSTLVREGTDAEELEAVRGLLSLADRWTFARALDPQQKHVFEHWSTHKLPKTLDYGHLVELKHPNSQIPEVIEGRDEHLRRRVGFALTDPRMKPREVMGEVDYCILCHEREKDSCSKGFKAKDPVAEGSSFKKNALGIPLTGCPLDERISEMHTLKGRGDSVGALSLVMLDNPMCPGTGHRICNDCMKACIYQKQEPVNIPQIETSVLTDVLALPWGFEIYGLLTRWNPLNVKRPHALPYVGKNVLVVGLGPAGYTLCHYLLNEGFAVAAVDGLKIEHFPDELTGKNGHPMRPIRDFGELKTELHERVLAGFGGVSEYGITVRWDKNFLNLLHLTLARREQFRTYGGIRFGGTLTIEDAWKLGFDHIAIAAGAGRPTLVNIKNNLIRGIRKASDFLMALQLTGAFKADSLANLQVQLPAIVIGGGLTAVDTATELTAYYPVQVEKLLARHEKLVSRLGEAAVFGKLDAVEKETLQTFLAHGREVREERVRAAAAGETPNLVEMVRKWGGVAVCYRRSLQESPAYRLNHEEVAKALEEGIRFIERMSPLEAIPDEHGAVRALVFERMASVDGKLKGTGEKLEMAARTVCVAAGTSPNVTYEKEYPGTFNLDEDQQYFRGYQLGPKDAEGFTLEEVAAHEDLAVKTGFFTSYRKHGRYISFYGDNHPTYAGNVVKAMASAKDGYSEVVQLFAEEVTALDLQDEVAQAARNVKALELFGRMDAALNATVVSVNRLTPTIVEVVVKAPFAAERFQPGQFYRLQNFERLAPVVEGTRLSMEGLALTGAWVDREKGILSTIVLEMGSSSKLCAALRPGEPVVLMGPTGAPTEIPEGETVLLAGGGLGNAVLFSIARSLRAANCKVLYFAGYRQASDVFKQDDIEASSDQIIYSVDVGEPIVPRRSQDGTFKGNVVEAMVAYGKGEFKIPQNVKLSDVDRIIAIGSDRMMRAVKEARGHVLRPFLKERHEAIGSINSPMQCMMKEICAQCLQKHIDPVTGKETVVFSCFNQDQRLDTVDFNNLASRLKANSVVEKMSTLWLDYLLLQAPHLKRV